MPENLLVPIGAALAIGLAAIGTGIAQAPDRVGRGRGHCGKARTARLYHHFGRDPRDDGHSRLCRGRP